MLSDAECRVDRLGDEADESGVVIAEHRILNSVGLGRLGRFRGSASHFARYVAEINRLLPSRWALRGLRSRPDLEVARQTVTALLAKVFDVLGPPLPRAKR